MGCKSSPFNAVRFKMIREEIIRGNREKPGNVLGWDMLRLNLPGDPQYDSKKGWCQKIKILSDASLEVANDFVTYVDDVRVTGNSPRAVRCTSHVVASRTQWLGQQDASRKRRQIHQGTNAWAGSIIVVECDNIYVTVDQEKWVRGQTIVKELLSHFDGKEGNQGVLFDFKSLERDRGFLIHLAMT